VLPNSPIILKPNTSLYQATLAMEERNCSAVLVIAENQLLGIFTLEDLRKAVALDLPFSSTTLAEVCTTPVITLPVSQQTNIAAILHLRRSHNITHLPFVDHTGYPVSIIELKQILEQLEAAYESQSISQIQLEREAANLRLATELNHIGCWHLNLISNQSEWNDIQFQLMGLLPNREKMSYFSWRESVHPDDQAMVDQAFSQAIASHQELEVRHRVVLPNGNVCWHLTRGKALYNLLDHPMSMVGITVDITENGKLQIERDRLFDFSSTLLIITDQTGKILQLNPAWETNLGYTIEECLGRSFLDFVYVDDRETTISHMTEQAISQNPTQDFEIRYRSKDGDLVWLCLDCYPFPSEQKIYGFGRNITTRKIAEQSLQALNLELEAIVAERTSQLEASVNRISAMLNAIPDRLVLIKSDGTCLDWNLQLDPKTTNKYISSEEHITKLLMLKSKLDFLRAFDQSVITKEVQVYENLIVTEYQQIYQEIRFSPCGEDEILILIRDISDRKVAENLIIQNEQYLKAIVQLQSMFLSLPFEQALPHILKILGEVTNSSRAFIFKNDRDRSDRLFTSQISKWCAPGISAQIDNLDLQNLAFDISTGACIEKLSQGEYINQLVSALSGRERQRLEQQEIKSFLAFPLQFQGVWWGVLGFDQCDKPRIWTELEIELLRAASSSISLAIERQESENSSLETTEKLRQSNKFIQHIAETVPGLLYIFDLEQRGTVYTNQSLGEFLGYQKGELEARSENTFHYLMHPDDLAVLSNHFSQSQTFNQSQTYSLEYRLRTKNGGWNWYLSQNTVFSRNPEGKVTELIGTATDISDRKATEQKLQNSLAEKEVLLKEVHHRVKNNLNVIDGLLSLQIRAIENIELKQQLQDSRQRISIMALVHQQLYQTEKLNQVNFAEYINSLCQNLYQAYVLDPSLITMEVKVEQMMVDVDIATPLGLILSELLTNAFKYAFPAQTEGEGKGNVVVEFCSSLKSSESLPDQPIAQLDLWVKDNGIGIKPNDRQKPASLGMELIKILTQQLRATIKVESYAESGTSIHLILPIART